GVLLRSTGAPRFFSAGAQPPPRRSEFGGAPPPGFGAPSPKRHRLFRRRHWGPAANVARRPGRAVSPRVHARPHAINGSALSGCGTGARRPCDGSVMVGGRRGSTAGPHPQKGFVSFGDGTGARRYWVRTALVGGCRGASARGPSP